MIAIAGGIGAGKSVVSRILRLRGFGVYDCDAEAKRLMGESKEIIAAMAENLGEEVVDSEGRIDRAATARIIFNDEGKRLWLNSLVHSAVREDVMRWTAENPKNRFVESAIAAESGLLALCDEVWIVDAPEEVRLQRAMKRSKAPEADIRRRIEAQRKETEALIGSGLPVRYINNVDSHSLLKEIGEG